MNKTIEVDKLFFSGFSGFSELLKNIKSNSKEANTIKKKIKKEVYNFDTFIDIEYINCIIYMYSCGIYINDISNYTGLHPEQVNVIIDAYNDCLN